MRPIRGLARRTTTRTFVAAALAGAALAGCGSSSNRASTAASGVAVATPLATSLSTPAATLAFVPLGQLDSPQNTFWQLLVRPGASPTWSDQVEATGTATNGGLVGAAAGTTVTVGVAPSQLLTFSPLIVGHPGTGPFAPAPPAPGLAPHPDSLVVGGNGAGFALTGTGAAESLSATTAVSGSAGWDTASTLRALAASPVAHACGPVGLTAVALAGDRPVVGAACSRSGAVGLYLEQDGHWSSAGTVPAPAAASGPTTVVDLRAGTSGMQALIAAPGPSGPRLAAAWGSPGGRWTVSDFPAATGSLLSAGPLGDDGAFVLTGTAAAPRLTVTTAPGAAWQTLPAPPAGTATVAAASLTGMTALATTPLGAPNTVTVWTLTPGGSWQPDQVLPVNVPLGSSA